MTGSASLLHAKLMSLATKGGRRIALSAKLGWYKLLAPFGHCDYVPFIVLTRSRTGSNLLVSFLNGHPDIFCEGEIFARMNGRDPVARLESAFGRQPRRVKAKGFKIFYYHPLDADATEIWKRLEGMKELRIIHLTRSNVLRTLLSRKIAGYQDRWTATRFDKNRSGTKRVTFTARELEEGFRETLAWEATATARFRAHSMFRLSYEELVVDPNGAYARILAFLGARRQPPRTSLSRQNPEHLPELIQNYEELKRQFIGTPWQQYFDD